MPKINANGVNLHYITIGAGPDIVMLHGFLGNLAVWHLYMAPILRREFRVTTYDLRGHGYSDVTDTGYTAADMAGLSRMAYSPAIRVVRLMCSGRLDPQFVVAAFRNGADGVLIGGCHPGDCHYQEGNYKALRRVALLHSLLGQLGIEPQRLRLEWISASEGEKVQRVCNEMAEQLRALGPLHLGFSGPEVDQVQNGHPTPVPVEAQEPVEAQP